MYLIDTDVLSALRRPDRAPQVARWIAGKPEDALFLSVVTLGEIERAIARQAGVNPAVAAELRRWLDRTETLFADRILPLDAAGARIWGGLTTRLGHGRTDLLIAATALAHRATVVTGDAGFAATGAATENPFV